MGQSVCVGCVCGGIEWVSLCVLVMFVEGLECVSLCVLVVFVGG